MRNREAKREIAKLVTENGPNHFNKLNRRI